MIKREGYSTGDYTRAGYLMNKVEYQDKYLFVSGCKNN